MKIKSYSYSCGIRNFAPRTKTFSDIATIAVEDPDVVYIPAKQMKGHLPIVVVAKGDEVKIGSRVAVSGNNVVYSTVSGLVEDIITLPSVYGGTTDVVVVRNNHKEDKEEFNKFVIETAQRSELLGALKQASVVDVDGYNVLDKIYSLPKDVEPTLVVNLVTDEPYQKNTLFLINEKQKECAMAIRTMATVLGAKNIIVAINKTDQKLLMPLLDEVGGMATLLNLNLSVAGLPDKYPLGDEEQLIQVLTNKKYKSTKDARQAGFVSFDMFTLFAVKNLLIDGEVTVLRPMSIIEKDETEIRTTCAWVTIGTPISEVLSALYLNGMQGIRKIVAGGPMRGIALGNEDVSTTFGLKSIMAIKDKSSDYPSELPCITCGKCAKVCPVKIVPYEIDECAINHDFSRAVNLGANKCIKCGCCSHVCPSKRYLTQRIYYAKEIISSKGLNNE